MRKIIASAMAILMFLLSGTMQAFATEDIKQTPSGIAYSELEKKLNEYIDIRKDTTSAVSITVFNEKDDIASVIYGDANTKDGIKADERTVYEWGPTSKILIWTSVMQLWEQEKIDLDTDIRKYLPEGFLSNLSYEEPITMLHLMNHRAGFQETTWDIEVTDKNDIVSLKQALLDTAPPQVYEPGKVCSYSNWGATLAAYIVECVSGMDYADYVHQYIFEPLKMEHTFVKPDGSDNKLVEHQRKKTNAYLNIQGAYEDYGECRRYILLYPAGSTTGTMSDLVLFAKAFLSESEDCPLFTKKDTLSIMLSPTLYYDGTDVARICHGLLSMQYGVLLIGHAGNTTGFSTNLMLDVKSKTGIVVMTNEVGETTYNYGLLSLVFGDCKADMGFTYDDLTGIYQMSRSNFDKSFLKIYGLISGLLPLSPNRNQGSYKVMLTESIITQISDNVCIMDDKNGTKTYLVIQRDKNGKVVSLQNMGAIDLHKANIVKFVLQVMSLLLFMLVSVWTFIMLVVHGITLHRFKGNQLFPKKLLQLLSEVFTVMMAGLIFSLVIIPDSFTKSQVMWKCILIIICTLAETVILVLGGICIRKEKMKAKVWLQEKQLNNGKRLQQKISFAITGICGVIMNLSVLYWQFYRFFGC